MNLSDREQHRKMLVERYCDSTAADQELEVFFAMVKSNELVVELENEMDKYIAAQLIYEKKVLQRKKRISLMKYAAVAAVLALVATVSFFNLKDKAIFNFDNAYLQDVKPGTDKAFLTLSNGKRIELNKLTDEAILAEAGVCITKNDKGEIIYEPTALSGSNLDAVNEISTPRGGEFVVKLSDGTKIWLNSVTTVRFPVSFKGVTKRNIEINGEAYFEVAKDKHRPFIVRSALQRIEVLGTHFNVNTFDKDNVITTLLEGKVNVISDNASNSRITLKPLQQAIVSKDKVSTREVDVDYVVAWKQGYFSFDNEPLEAIMDKISRWYDVKVVFEDDALRKKRFSGSVSRYANVSQLLKKLELTQSVKFNIENQIIKVYN